MIEEHSRVSNGISKGTAHGKAGDPGILQPHTEGANGLTHLIHQPVYQQGAGQQPARMFAQICTGCTAFCFANVVV